MQPPPAPAPPPVRASTRGLRIVLGGLLAFGALSAFGGGYYGMTGAENIPTELLRGSPFADYLVPSLILFVIVGGSLLGAAIAMFRNWRFARRAAMAAGAILLAWIAVQVAIIGYLSWLQPTTALVALLVLVLAWALPGQAA